MHPVNIIFYTQGLTLIQAYISNYTQYKVWNEIIYSFSNYNGATIEFCEWMRNFLPVFTGHVFIRDFPLHMKACAATPEKPLKYFLR